MAILIAILGLTSGPAAAQPSLSADCGAPVAMADGWELATPGAVGLDPAILCGVGPRFQGRAEANVHSVIVVRHGKLAYELYFSGTDERLGKSVGTVAFDAKTKHDLRSITKSVVSLVLGIVIAKGQIAGVEQTVMPLLPEYADLRSKEKDRITLRDLLTMSQGLRWNEDLPYSDPNNNEVQMDDASDPVRYTLSQPIETPPGQMFNYSAAPRSSSPGCCAKRRGSPSTHWRAPSCSSLWG